MYVVAVYIYISHTRTSWLYKYIKKLFCVKETILRVGFFFFILRSSCGKLIRNTHTNNIVVRKILYPKIVARWQPWQPAVAMVAAPKKLTTKISIQYYFFFPTFGLVSERCVRSVFDVFVLQFFVCLVIACVHFVSFIQFFCVLATIATTAAAALVVNEQMRVHKKKQIER